MKFLLKFAAGMDWLAEKLGVVAGWAVFLSCIISAGNAFVRYSIDKSSNGWLEIQWYLFALAVMFGTSIVLRDNEHVRVDVLYGRFANLKKVWVDIFGLSVFLMPVCIMMVYLSWPIFERMLVSGEMSNNAGGLIRWPAMLMLPLGFTLLGLQGLAEIIKRVGWLTGTYNMDIQYEKPLQ